MRVSRNAQSGFLPARNTASGHRHAWRVPIEKCENHYSSEWAPVVDNVCRDGFKSFCGLAPSTETWGEKYEWNLETQIMCAGCKYGSARVTDCFLISSWHWSVSDCSHFSRGSWWIWFHRSSHSHESYLNLIDNQSFDFLRRLTSWLWNCCMIQDLDDWIFPRRWNENTSLSRRWSKIMIGKRLTQNRCEIPWDRRIMRDDSIVWFEHTYAYES